MISSNPNRSSGHIKVQPQNRRRGVLRHLAGDRLSSPAPSRDQSPSQKVTPSVAVRGGCYMITHTSGGSSSAPSYSTAGPSHITLSAWLGFWCFLSDRSNCSLAFYRDRFLFHIQYSVVCFYPPLHYRSESDSSAISHRCCGGDSG